MSVLDEHLKKHRQRIIDREEATFRELLAAYQAIEKELIGSYNDLQNKIADAQAAGEEISLSWFYREKRLNKLLAQVTDQIVRFGNKATKIINREQSAAIKIAVAQAGETYNLLVENVLDAAGFVNLNPRTVETAVGMMGDGSPILKYFQEQLAPMVAEKIKSEVIKAAAVGTDFKKIAKTLQETGDITKHRALSVARTEVNRVRRETTLTVYEENSDIIEGWEWVASKSSRTCPLCLAQDGKQFKLNEPFPQHVNCLVAGTVVSSPGTLATSERNYEGEVIEIETSSGFKLTVTPNHPVMTSQGWIEAKFLNEGDNVISTPDAERMSIAINPHTDNVPTVIDEVIRSFGKRIGVKSVVMPHSAENFHGDGKGGDVNIVFSDRFLHNDFDSSFFEPKSQNLFINRGVSFSSLSAFRTFYQLVIRNFLASDSIMSRLGVSDIFSRTSMCHHQLIGFGTRADRYAVFNQHASDYITRNIETFSQKFFRNARQILLNDVVQRQINSFEFEESAVSENIVETISPDIEFCTNFIHTHSANVSVDCIVKIKRRFYSGHVFNLETTTGYYVANNIITHNCRCTMIPVIIGLPRRKRTIGKDWFESLDDETKGKILGKETLAIYKENGLTLDDFVAFRNDKRFGKSVTRKPLVKILADKRIVA